MIDVTQDAYDAWRDNDVTRRFIEELTDNLDEQLHTLIQGSHEVMIAKAYERNTAIKIFERLISWKPGNLERNDD